jgi:phosphatidylglycerol:prolipoprotein diacylglycerol transferase
VRPIPTAFHIGPLEFHTYGLGLAIAFYVAWRYLVARVRARGIRTDPLVELGIWVVVSALFGARLFHVLTNWSTYSSQPLQILEVWHGGLASFGGLLFAVPTALWVKHRRYPELGILDGLDIAVPALALGWAVGRILGPQLMVAGGGHPTTSWIGMYYADQVGKRIPVPIIQALEDGALFVLLILVERRLQRVSAARATRTPPTGALTAIAMVVWGIARGLDERLWLGEDGRLGSDLVQAASVALAIGGLVIGVVVYRNWRSYLNAPARPAVPGPTQLAGP